MSKIEKLKKEVWNAYHDNVEFIIKNNIKHVKDESPEIQAELKRLEKIVCKFEQLVMDEARRTGNTIIIKL
jgi:hypothetical protein